MGPEHLVRVEIVVKGTNENLQLGPTLPEVPLYVMCSPEEAKLLTADVVLEGELRVKGI